MTYQETLQKFEMVAGRKLALTTERSYRTWIIPFLKFLPTAEGREQTSSESRIEVFLSRMAREDYSAVSQNQAFNAILFLYRNVIKVELKDINALRCRRMTRERYTPTQPEVLALLHELKNTPTYNVRLAGALMYACGLRVSECCQLRRKDFDLERMILTVWEGKGEKDRRVRIPEILLPAIRRQLARSGAFAQMDIEARQPVQLPGRMDRSTPSRQFDAEWHFLFPTPHPCAHPRTGKMVRWCISPDVLQTCVKAAGKRAGITSRLTPHCLRHGFCSHLLDAGENIKRVGEAMGHSDIRTTAGYGRKACEGMASPLDRMVIPFRKTA
jgi:site-specific recombinase XerD